MCVRIRLWLDESLRVIADTGDQHTAGLPASGAVEYPGRPNRQRELLGSFKRRQKTGERKARKTCRAISSYSSGIRHVRRWLWRQATCGGRRRGSRAPKAPVALALAKTTITIVIRRHPPQSSADAATAAARRSAAAAQSPIVAIRTLPRQLPSSPSLPAAISRATSLATTTLQLQLILSLLSIRLSFCRLLPLGVLPPPLPSLRPLLQPTPQISLIQFILLLLPLRPQLTTIASEKAHCKASSGGHRGHRGRGERRLGRRRGRRAKRAPRHHSASSSVSFHSLLFLLHYDNNYKQHKLLLLSESSSGIGRERLRLCPTRDSVVVVAAAATVAAVSFEVGVTVDVSGARAGCPSCGSAAEPSHSSKSPPTGPGPAT